MLLYFRLILIGVYVWSGIHKLNNNFIEDTITRVFAQFVSETGFNGNWRLLGYLIPAIEISIGVMLAFPGLRNTGVLLSFLTHCCILFILGPYGAYSNSIVYPWNLAMMIMVFLLFYNSSEQLISWKKEIFRPLYLVLIPFIVVGILPALNFVGMWDHYLSFSLYSGKPHEYFIAIEESELNKLGDRYVPYYVDIEGMNGGAIINVSHWSIGELNVPFYPETRVFKKLSASFCERGIPDDKIYFLEFERPVKKMKHTAFQCSDM